MMMVFSFITPAAILQKDKSEPTTENVILYMLYKSYFVLYNSSRREMDAAAGKRMS